MATKIVLISILFFVQTHAWENTCGSGGDKIHGFKVNGNDLTVSCAVKKGKLTSFSADVSFAQPTKNLKLTCDGQLGLFTLNVFAVTQTCDQVQKTGSDASQAGCSQLNAGTSYTISAGYTTPLFAPTGLFSVQCTFLNDKKVKTHCVKLQCRAMDADKSSGGLGGLLGRSGFRQSHNDEDNSGGSRKRKDRRGRKSHHRKHRKSHRHHDDDDNQSE